MVIAPGARGIRSPYAVDIRVGRLDAFHVTDIHLHRVLVIASPPERRTAPAMEEVVDILAQLLATMSEQAEFRLTARRPWPEGLHSQRGERRMGAIAAASVAVHLGAL
jgi:hypothetical protein